MGLREEILKARKEKFGLNKVDTKKVFDCIFDIYKEMILAAPRNVLDYYIYITICNINNYNRLGDLFYLDNNWGDNFYVDLNNSYFLKAEVDTTGEIITDDNTKIFFDKIDEFKVIKDISFSVKKFIDYCKENDIMISIFTTSEERESQIFITPCRSYKQSRWNTYDYIESIK